MSSMYLVISLDSLDDRLLDIKAVAAESEKEAIERSGFITAVAVRSEIRTSTHANINRVGTSRRHSVKAQARPAVLALAETGVLGPDQ